MVDFIKHQARSLIFSASMPPATIASTGACLKIIEQEPERVLRLQAIGRRMIAGYKSLGFNVGVTETPIVPLLIGDLEKTILFWRALFDGGVFTNPVLSPAVPRTARSSAHPTWPSTPMMSATRSSRWRAGPGRKFGIL